jgi:hypothetical protein
MAEQISEAENKECGQVRIYRSFRLAKIFRYRNTQKQNNKDWIKYGKDNDYPDYLITLAERSSTHRAIVTGKVDLILGKGMGSDGRKQHQGS